MAGNSQPAIRLSLLSRSTTQAEVQQACIDAREQGIGLVVPPSLLQYAPEDVPLASTAGYPSGQHHTLVKAAEARLAVQSGASMVAVVPQLAHLAPEQSYALITEVVALREAIPAPAQLAIVVDVDAVPATQPNFATLCKTLHKCGVDALLLEGTAPETLPLRDAAGMLIIAHCENEQAPAWAHAGAHELWVRV